MDGVVKILPRIRAVRNRYSRLPRAAAFEIPASVLFMPLNRLRSPYVSDTAVRSLDAVWRERYPVTSDVFGFSGCGDGDVKIVGVSTSLSSLYRGHLALHAHETLYSPVRHGAEARTPEDVTVFGTP